MTYYLYNNTSSMIVILDMGLELPAGSHWEFQSNDIPFRFKSGGDHEAFIDSGEILLTTDPDLPPATSIPKESALKIFTLNTWADEVVFDDSETGWSVDNVQDAIEKTKIEIEEIVVGAIPDFVVIGDPSIPSQPGIIFVNDGGFVLKSP